MYDHGFKDLTGQKFGEWLVLRRAEPFSYKVKKKERNRRRIHFLVLRYLCRCSCGREATVIGNSLRSGKSTRCRKCGTSRKKIEGTIQGGFAVGKFVGVDIKSNQAKYECICSRCGKKCILQQGRIIRQKSCGCLRKKEPGHSGLNRL